uniref:LsmAD domain-containing protein n=1 Tax=Meloidogyne hapla TaxID=6305 RepID=A0A1I8BV85_MELHA
MSDPALVPFQFDSDTEHPLGQRLDNLSDDGTIPDEDIYDAINDETFGVETSLISAKDSDLADFSIRTANLVLDDSPTTSSKPPDPSQIPIPQMGSDHCLHFVSSTSDQRNLEDFKRQIFYDRAKHTNNSNADINVSPSIWGTGTFNGINSLLDIYKGQQTLSHPMYVTSNFNTLSPKSKSSTEKKSPSPLANLWPQFAHENTFPAMFGSELERKLLSEAISNSEDIVAQCASPTPISANDLERKLLDESIRNSLFEHGQKQKELSIQCQQQEKDLSSNVLPSPLSHLPQRTPQHFNKTLLPPHPHYHQNWQQQQIQHPFPLQSPAMPPPPFLLPSGMSPLQLPPMFNPMTFLQHPPHPDIARTMAMHAVASTAAALQSGRQSIVVTPHLVGTPLLQHLPDQNLNQTPLHHIQDSPNILGQQGW